MGSNLGGYFDNLAAAALNEKQVLEDMVKSMPNLTETNEVLTKTNAALTHQLAVVRNWKYPSGQTGLSNPNPRGGSNPGHGGGPSQTGAGRTKK